MGFPTRTYSTSSQNLTVKFIPSQSQYSVRDALTEDVIIPFTTGSYLSCDGTGNFFRLDLNAFQPERHYRFLYKVVSGSGNTRVEHSRSWDHLTLHTEVTEWNSYDMFYASDISYHHSIGVHHLQRCVSIR